MLGRQPPGAARQWKRPALAHAAHDRAVGHRVERGGQIRVPELSGVQEEVMPALPQAQAVPCPEGAPLPALPAPLSSDGLRILSPVPLLSAAGRVRLSAAILPPCGPRAALPALHQATTGALSAAPSM